MKNIKNAMQFQAEIRFYRPLYGILILLGCMPAYAGDAVNQLNRFLADTRTLSADFKQVAIDEAGRPGQLVSGIFLLAKPGRFRWDYLKPYKQEIVANGKKVWFYDVDLEQVTVKQLGNAIGSTPALLLTGEVSLDENFVIEDQGEREGMRWTRLVPRSEDNTFKTISIGIQENHLRGMELSDNFGQLTRISFSNIRINDPIEAKRFEFVAPAGVDVFEDKAN
ncbi:MAG: outer membrane lipoprotein chaperone LolA [Methylococcaceae bacterium]|nr:outer membrane lipoprotein chaperone LolA [Methylococcaceae bacterium]MCI0732931.1 outer membrane lipoprotein chaperone LolA [Methylococcaceae bacterium]